MITSVKMWNEPKDLSHWDFLIDPGWTIFAEVVRQGADAIRALRADLPVVLGGKSPIDARFLHQLQAHGALDAVDVLALHGFPLDWNLWPVEEWSQKIEAIRSEFAHFARRMVSRYARPLVEAQPPLAAGMQ